jgi:hypothetical protein
MGNELEPRSSANWVRQIVCLAISSFKISPDEPPARSYALRIFLRQQKLVFTMRTSTAGVNKQDAKPPD